MWRVTKNSLRLFGHVVAVTDDGGATDAANDDRRHAGRGKRASHGGPLGRRCRRSFGDESHVHDRIHQAGLERLAWLTSAVGHGEDQLQQLGLRWSTRAGDLDRARRSRLDELEHGRHLQYTGLRYAGHPSTVPCRERCRSS